ncbi:MAG: T9SS type B sorting domain-containing protein, partial [Bacteroidetes bacterium]|nr:T9SS type B sorting domain-containing protein [Bacteroidota bacterium]
AYAYSWSNGQNTTNSFNLAPEGYHLTVTDENGCTSIDSIGIDELEDVFVNVVLSKPSCYGLSDGSMGVNIVTGGSGAGYTFSWNTTPVQSSELIENLAGDIEYTVTVTDDQGCMQTNTAFLHEPPQITFDLENTPANCFGSNDGTATVNNVQGENTTYSYEWSSNANGQTDSTAINLSAGIYTLIISDENDCVVSGTVEIEQPSQINIEFEVADNRCSGENIGAIATTVSGGISAYTYEWSTQETDKKIGSLFAGNYTLSVTDANGCLQVDSAEVQDPEAISASLIKTDVTCFSGRDGSFSIEALGGTPPYTYSTDNEYFNGSTSIVGLSAGEYNVYVKDAYECLWYEPASIENPPEFVVEIDPEEAQINVGDSILLSAFSTNGTEPVQYFWSAPYEGTLGCTDCLDTYAKPQNTIHYSLNGEDANGCRASTSILVVVIKDRMIAVPTGFSPNGDYINDLLLVHGKERTKVKMFRVFDRWGELLYEKGDFEVNDPNIGWDGTYRSTEMNTGTYIWFLEVEYIDGVEEVFKGQTTLIR